MLCLGPGRWVMSAIQLSFYYWVYANIQKKSLLNCRGEDQEAWKMKARESRGVNAERKGASEMKKTEGGSSYD